VSLITFTIEILCKDTKIILNKRQKSLKNIVYGTESKRSRTSIHTGEDGTIKKQRIDENCKDTTIFRTKQTFC